MLKSMRNGKYIFAKSYKIFTLTLSLWGFITLVTPTDILLDFIKNGFLRILAAAMIILIIYLVIIISVTACTLIIKKIKVFSLHSNHSVYVEYGDLFACGKSNEMKNIAFAGNRCFDTIVDDDLIGSSKIHGVALNRIYENHERDQDIVNKEIQESLSKNGYKKEVLSRHNKRSGNLYRYEVGAVAEIQGLKNERYFILGLTYFDNRLRANVDKDEYIKAVSSLVKYISDRSQGDPTYISVIGAGGSDVGTINELIGFIIKIIELYKDRIDCDIHIIVDKKEEVLDLFNLKMI